MEVKEKSKKRELIKTIAIIFLAVLLVLTFFSNTIMNRSLPEVATGMVNSGTINAKIRGSGTVSANETYEVIINQTREVRSVCVKVGDTVAQGDLLFVLGDVESQELQEAQSQLQTLNIEYQKQLLNLSKEYATNDLSIKTLQEDLQKAIQQRDANVVTDAEISYAKGDLATAKNELTQIGLVVDELNAMLTDNEEYQEAQAAVTKWTQEVSSAETAVETYEKQLEELDSGGSVDLDRQIADAKSALEKAKNTWRSEWLAYRDDLGKLMEAVRTEYSSATEINTSTDTPQQISGNNQVYIEAYLTQNVPSTAPTGGGGSEETALAAFASDGPTDDELKSYETAYNALLTAQNDVASKQTAYDRLIDDQDIASGSASEQRRAIQKKLDEAESELRAAQRELRDAEDALEKASGANSALKEQIKLYEAAKREQDARIETLNNQITTLEEKKTAYDAAVATISEKERALEEALNGKDIDKQLDDLDLQATRLNIQKQQELVDKYKAEAIGTEIKANVSGVVSAINVSAGKETTAGSPMATINVVDRGYTIKIPVTNEQAKQVKVGDTAEVSNYYWGNDIQATLESITSDPDKPGQGKLLIFRITGEIDNGTTISLSIGQRSANYDSIIPKSALREDTNGRFVLVVTAKSSPLGNRYVATRVDVQVLAEDDTSAAVTGLAQGDYVITTSSKPLEAGTLVRLVENP